MSDRGDSTKRRRAEEVALSKEVEDFLRLLGEECKTCFDRRRCDECYSPRAKMLFEKISSVRVKNMILSPEEVAILTIVRAAGGSGIRLGDIDCRILRGKDKRAVLDRLIALRLVYGVVRKGRTKRATWYFPCVRKEA